MVALRANATSAGLLRLHAQLDPDAAATASGVSQLKEPAGGGVELHQGHHALHPRRGGAIREALLVGSQRSDLKSPRSRDYIKIKNKKIYVKKNLTGGNPF